MNEGRSEGAGGKTIERVDEREQTRDDEGA